MDLIICSTPLHVLQMESLINKSIVDDFDFIFFSKKDSEQIKYYFNLLGVHSQDKYFFLNERRFYNHANEVKKIFKNKKYNSVFFATIDSLYVQYILSLIKFDKIKTIDDGTANIVLDSHYYINRESLTHLCMRFIFGLKFNTKKIKENISVHYTIYNGYDNIAKNVISNTLNFESCKKTNEKVKKGIVKILLGTVFSDLCSDEKKLIYLIQKNLIKKGEEFYYIPHPRFQSKCFNGVKSIPGQKIAEDKVIEISSMYDEVILYGFNSSAQLNLALVDNIRNITIKSKTIDNPFYNNIDFGFSIINID
ncbi:glycosyltransferase family 52 [Photobacterium damselae]|uniref:glycosyltransferase family 52 n=1 Tax=Photobacterium damselae TaxID=38293 RepID=UPI004068FADC